MGSIGVEKNRAVILSLILVVLFMTASACAEPRVANGHIKKVIIGGDYNYAPYEFLDKNGVPAGYNVELSKAIAKVMGFEIEIVLGDWEQIRKALDDGRVDIVQGMVFSKQRDKNYDFSPPHILVYESLIGRKGCPNIHSLAELAGKEVIVQNKGMSHDFLLNQNININIFPVSTHSEALRLLASGKHDYAFVGKLPGLYTARQIELSNLKSAGNIVAPYKYCYAVKQGNTDLLSLFNEGLAILKNTGKHKQIYDKWLSAVEPASLFWKKIVYVLAIFFGVLIVILSIILFWNKTLQKQVVKRTDELQLQQQQLIQADKMASLGMLVSGVAHEINNPNSVILLNTPLVKEYFDHTVDVVDAYCDKNGDFMIGGLSCSELINDLPEMLDEIQEGSLRIKRTVNDLKDFARQEDNSLSQNIDINGIAQKAIRLLENRIKKSTDRFSQDLQPELPVINGNTQRIEQVFINLILNACQALEDKSEAVSVSTGYDIVSDHVFFQVIDEGVGISPDILPKLTDPFFTTKRETGGTGLGLSISSKIIERHGGTMHFGQTEEGKTLVKITFPKGESEANDE